jgi:hypothetical protein
LKCNKITPNSRRSPPSHPLLIIGMENSLWHTNPTLRIANEIWRSGKEPHPSRVLFIGPSKRLNDCNAPGA